MSVLPVRVDGGLQGRVPMSPTVSPRSVDSAVGTLRGGRRGGEGVPSPTRSVK